MKQAAADVAALEKGIFKADTESQAQAQILEMVNNVAKANGVQTRGLDEYHSKPISNDYGEVTVTVELRQRHRATGELPGGAGEPGSDSGDQRDPHHRRHRQEEDLAGAAERFRPGSRKLLAPEKKGLAGF